MKKRIKINIFFTIFLIMILIHPFHYNSLLPVMPRYIYLFIDVFLTAASASIIVTIIDCFIDGLYYIIRNINREK